MPNNDGLLIPIELRFWHRVRKGEPDDCWLWTGALNFGYGVMTGGRRGTPLIYVHRFSYELHIGPIPEGLTIDHLCRNRECVNPRHLEAVTRGENVRRGDGASARNARKTHCPHGHPYDEANTVRNGLGHRRCRVCRTVGWKRHRDLQRSAGAD